METNDKNPAGAPHEDSVRNEKQLPENHSTSPLEIGHAENLTQAEESGRAQNQIPVPDNNRRQTEKQRQDREKEKRLSGPRKASRRLWLIAACILIILVVAGTSLASCSKSKHMNTQPQAEPEFKYERIETSWNQYIANYPPKFKLLGDRGGNDANIIKAINHWLSAFSVQPGSDYVEELDRLKNTYGVTAFHAWEDFRREHHRQHELTLNPEMSFTDLAREINNYIGIARPQNPQDSISADTVKTIVYMNSICAFFEGERDALHKEGIDTEIEECKKLDPGENFPLLQKSLNN